MLQSFVATKFFKALVVVDYGALVLATYIPTYIRVYIFMN